jgi:proton-dependent oligopeptide transporter, POT family
MASNNGSASPGGPPAQDTRFLGHPRGLSTLFFTEMWERFSFYGMKAILIYFMTTEALKGGLGMSPEKAGPIYAIYTSLVYLTTLAGGWLADNFLGQRKSVFYGGIVIMIGHISLALHGLVFFYAGLACVVVGTGLLKPNISAIVGQLYSENDQRRDSGFSIFYMGINVGAFISPLVCGYLAQDEAFRARLIGWGLDPNNSWHWGFAAAAVGMFFGLLQYVITDRHLGEAGKEPPGAKDPARVVQNRRTLVIGVVGVAALASAIALLAISAPQYLSEGNIHFGTGVLLLVVVVTFFYRLFTAGDWTPGERARLILIAILFAAAAIFWAVFDQAGSTLSLFAERSTDNRVFGFAFPSSWWQSINPIMIVALTPFFSWFWIRLGDKNPSYPTKFGIGLVFAGLGFLWLVGGALGAEGGKLVGVHWLFGVFLLHTIGELFLSPVGLSSMTKLAPQRVQGLMMGVWFLASALGAFIGGSVSGYYEKLALPTLLTIVAASALVMAAIMFALVRPVKRMMAVAEAEAAAGAAPKKASNH